MKREKLRVSLPAVIAMGSNLGDREATIMAAVHELDRRDGISVDAVSSLYETEAVKPSGADPEAPLYLNGVVTVRSALQPRELLRALHDIERVHGRVREERWGDRTLDLDLISFAGMIHSDETLTLPHPRAWERAFVLAPWLEIQPDAEIPGKGKVAELLVHTGETPRRFAGPPR